MQMATIAQGKTAEAGNERAAGRKGAGARGGKLIAAESARTAGSLHRLPAAAPVSVVSSDAEPTSAAAMVAKLSASATVSKSTPAGKVTATASISVELGGGKGGASSSGAKGGSSPREGDPDVAYAFKLMIDSVAYATFSEISGLSWKAEAIPVRSGGNNEYSQYMRGPGKFEPLTMKRGFFAANGEFYQGLGARRGPREPHDHRAQPQVPADR
jgi:hypothetical protein